MTWTNLVYVLIFSAIHAVFSIIIHEAGHLVFGLATGYRFGSFNILSFVWARGEEGKIIFRRNKNSLVAGQCLMRPVEDEEKFRFVLYNLGGGLFNLVGAAACLPGMLMLPFGTPLYLLCLAGVAVNAAQAIVNLVPMNLEVPNDGMNAFKASRSALAKRGMWLMLRVNDEVQRGKRFRDYAEEDFAFEGEANPKNYFECYMLMLQSARLEDLGEHAAAMAVYDGLDLDRVTGYYASLIRTDLLYYYSVYGSRHDKAQEIYEGKAIQKLLKIQSPTLMRIRAGYLYAVLDMPVPARELVEKARAALEKMPSAGLRAMETDELEALAEMIDAGEQNSLDGAGAPADEVDADAPGDAAGGGEAEDAEADAKAAEAGGEPAAEDGEAEDDAED